MLRDESSAAFVVGFVTDPPKVVIERVDHTSTYARILQFAHRARRHSHSKPHEQLYYWTWCVVECARAMRTSAIGRSRRPRLTTHRCCCSIIYREFLCARTARYGRRTLVRATGGHKELCGATRRAQLSYACRCEKVVQLCVCTQIVSVNAFRGSVCFSLCLSSSVLVIYTNITVRELYQRLCELLACYCDSQFQPK